MFARLLRRTGLAVSLLLIGLSARAQFTGTVNTYARITAITPNSPVAGQTTLTVDNIGGASTAIGQFVSAGNIAHIFQMRGATVDVGSTTSATHGAVTALNNAGNNEQVVVISATGSSIVVDRILRRSYTVGEGLQIVHVPVSTAATATITGNLTAPAWSPTTSTGGVIMLIAQNTLEVGADVNANGLGFAGGLVSDNAAGGGPPCNNTDFAIDFTSATATVRNQGAQKGSGIAPLIPTQSGGRGRWTNGGGGGNRNNAGGGGGANYSAGSIGGSGVFSDAGCDFPTNDGGRGRGGDALDYSTGRLFLGGGGGGGHQDNGANNGTSGAAGGGIIILSAGTLTVTGTRTISANGNNAANTGGNEGAGAGGGGGVVVLEVGTYSLPASPACTGGSLTVSVNGGNGGNSNGTGTTRGGGGGGGVGYLAVTNTAFTGQCITFNSNPGTTGFSCAAGPPGCPLRVGSDPAGSLPPGCTVAPCTIPVGPVVSPLPIVLTSLTGQRLGPDVLLAWTTASELNNSHFVVERSGDGQNYTFLTTVPGNGTSSRSHYYRHLDREAPTGDLYYRLRQIDFDGTETVYGPIRVRAESGEPSLRVVRNPVPVGQAVAVEVSGSAGRRLELVDLNGRVLAYQWVSAAGTTLVPLYAHELTTGLYIVRLQGTRLSARVVIE